MALRFRDAYQTVKQRTRNWVPPLLALVFCLLALRLFWFLDRYAVDLFFYDQWNYLKTALADASLWEGLWTPIGPHRLGLAYPLYKFTLVLGDYNNVYLVYLVGGLAVLNSLLFLGLKRSIQGAYYLSDVFIPLIFFDLNQHALYFTNPNIAIHQLPFTFLILLAWYFIGKPPRWLRMVVPFLLPLVIFTGNGFFVGIAAVLYAGYRYLTKVRRKDDLALVVSGGLALLAYLLTAHYVSFDCADSPPQGLLYYLSFIKGMFLNGLVIGQQSSALSWLVFVGLALLLLWGFWFSRSQYRQLDAYPMFFIYSLLFVAATLMSRWCYGLAITESSRYIPHLALLFMAFGLLRFRNNRLMQWLHGGFLALVFIYAQVKFYQWRLPMVQEHSQAMETWRACYLQGGSVEKCNDQTNFRIYPQENDHFDLSKQLDQLEERNPNYQIRSGR